MKSKQINFFLTPEDVEEVNHYLKEKNLLVSPQPLPAKTVTLVDSLLVRNLDNDFQVRGQKYIFRAEDKQHVKVEYIAQQDYYSIEITNSPVIEFLYPSYKPNLIRPGRVYFVKNALNQDTNQEETKKRELSKSRRRSVPVVS
ncbi:MAG: hypothetical protein AAF518_27610 [Spirochaetota bacterium]